MMAWAKMRHYAGSVHLQGQKLAATAVLVVTHDFFGKLDGNTAYTLHKQDTEYDHHRQHHDFQDEKDKTAAVGFHFGTELHEKGRGQVGDDTDHDEDGDTVSDAFVGDTLTQPHTENGTENQQRDSHDPPNYRIRTSPKGNLGRDVTGRLEGGNEYGKAAGDLV